MRIRALRIQDEMVDCEKKIVSSLVSRRLLTQDSYLIKDGSIQYKPMKTGNFKELAHIRNNADSTSKCKFTTFFCKSTLLVLRN